MAKDGKRQYELGADTEHRELPVRDHLANERTLLSWIRLSIAVSGLGFVVARFGLFLDEIFLQQPTLRRTPGLSVPIGVVLTLALVAG
jgi:putative membrane protein